MSPTKKRQTMGKITRERELTERRAMKQEKKDRKKQAAALGEVEVVDDDPGDGDLEAADPPAD
jgi:hypothetical protein